MNAKPGEDMATAPTYLFKWPLESNIPSRMQQNDTFDLNYKET